MSFFVLLIVAILSGDVISRGLVEKNEDSNNFKIRSDGISAISNVYRKISPKENIEEVVLVPHRLRQVKFLNTDFKWMPGSSRRLKDDQKRLENFELYSKRDQRVSNIKKFLIEREANKKVDSHKSEKEKVFNKKGNSAGKANSRLFIDDGGTNNYYRVMQEYNKLNGGDRANSKTIRKNEKSDVGRYETKLVTYNPAPKVTKYILTNLAENGELKDDAQYIRESNESNGQSKVNNVITRLEPEPVLITEGSGYKIPAYSHDKNEIHGEQMEDVINTSGDFTNELHGKGAKNRKNNNKYDSVYNIPGSIKSYDDNKMDDTSIVFKVHDDKKNRKGYRPLKFIEKDANDVLVREDKAPTSYHERKLKQGLQTGMNAAPVYTMEDGQFYRDNPIFTKKYNKNVNFQESGEAKTETCIKHDKNPSDISEHKNTIDTKNNEVAYNPKIDAKNKDVNLKIEQIDARNKDIAQSPKIDQMAMKNNGAANNPKIDTKINDFGYNTNIDKFINDAPTIKPNEHLSLAKNENHAYLNGAVNYSQNSNDAGYMSNFEQHSLLKNEANQIHPDDANDTKDKTLNYDSKERINTPMVSTKIYGVTAKPNINSFYSVKDMNKKQDIPTESPFLDSAGVGPIENERRYFYNGKNRGAAKLPMEMSRPVNPREFDVTLSPSFTEATTTDLCDLEVPPSAFMIAQKAAEKALYEQRAQNAAAMKASSEVRLELAKKAEIASDAASESITDKQVIVDLLEEIADNMKHERQSNSNRALQCNLEQQLGLARDEVDITRESLDTARRIAADIDKISDGVNDIKVRSELSLEANKMKLASLRDRVDDERVQMCVLEHKIEELKSCKKKKKRRKFRFFKWSRDDSDAFKRHVN